MADEEVEEVAAVEEEEAPAEEEEVTMSVLDALKEVSEDVAGVVFASFRQLYDFTLWLLEYFAIGRIWLESNSLPIIHNDIAGSTLAHFFSFGIFKFDFTGDQEGHDPPWFAHGIARSCQGFGSPHGSSLLPRQGLRK